MDCSSSLQSAPAASGTLQIRICRLCLCRTPVVFSLLDAKIAEMLRAVAAIEVSSADPVFTKCCLKCLLNLKLAYRIRLRIQDNERRLKEVSVEIIKQECSSAEEFLETDYIYEEESVACSLSPALSDEADNKPLCKVESIGPRCLICLKNFEDFASYDSHFSECLPLRGGGRGQKTKKQTTKNRKVAVVMRRRRGAGKRPKVMEIVVTPEGKYKCDICSKEYPTRDRCRKHLYGTHKTRPCPICKKTYSYTNLGVHMDTHSSDTARICDLCGKTFKNKAGLRSHIFYYHNSFRYSCDQCGRAYMKKAELRRHFNSEHNDNPVQCICDSCGLKFNDRKRMRDHILRIHERKSGFPCKYCNKNFSTQNSLRTHIRQHTNETPYTCKVCGEGFRQNVSLRSHLRSKHGVEEKKDVPCQVCGKAFATKHAVKSHMRLHNL